AVYQRHKKIHENKIKMFPACSYSLNKLLSVAVGKNIGAGLLEQRLIILQGCSIVLNNSYPLACNVKHVYKVNPGLIIRTPRKDIRRGQARLNISAANVNFKNNLLTTTFKQEIKSWRMLIKSAL